MPISETGHARNVEHFSQMIGFVQGYGAAYAPSNTAILLTALQAKLTAAQGSLDDVTAALAPWKTAAANRENSFKGLSKLATRIVNSLGASGAPQNIIDNAITYKRKLDGTRAEPVSEDDPVSGLPPAGGGTMPPPAPEPHDNGSNSVSQRSYTQRVEHFDNLIEIVTNAVEYDPNEAELKVTALTTLSTSLKASNNAVAATVPPLSNARIARDEVLYADGTGLCDLAALVKKYVKSLFGADSAQYKQISGLEFRASR